jgi:ParB-like chromosome segregation protein Spo0J
MARKKTAGSGTPGVPKTLRNRIVGTGTIDVAKLKENPKNWRTHSQEQESALEGLLTEVGWVQNVVINRTTGNLVDGHLRAALARKRSEKTIPVVYVELSLAEEELVLATLDPLGDLAGIDAKRLEELLAGLNPESVALAKLVADLEEELGIGKEDDANVETLLDQAVQLEPGKEFVVVMCDDKEEFERLQVALDLRTVRRGGYKAGSPFDAKGVDRVVKATKLLGLLGSAKR